MLFRRFPHVQVRIWIAREQRTRNSPPALHASGYMC
jgi:hypothetical protein